MSESSNVSGAESSAPVSPQPPQNDIVTRLRNLLGQDAVLLHVATGKKAPTSPGWQHTTVAEMEMGDYLMTLRHGNIGVLLGEASGGLCAIDIDHDDGVEPFLELNPAMRGTMRTRGSRGQQIWLRITGKHPKLTSLSTTGGTPWGEWRADGGQSVIHGVHPTGNHYQFIHEEAPIEIRFEDIVWPGELKLPWVADDEKVPAEYDGPAYEFGENGAVKLNQMFWVRRYMAEHTIVFDSAIGEFFEYDATSGKWSKQTQDSIKRAFMTDLEQTARVTKLKSLHFKLTEGLGVSLVGLLRTMSEQYDVFTTRPQAIHVKNGMICIEDGEVVLKTFSPDYYSRNVCPFDYDENANCPRFKAELLGVALNDDDIRLMQKWAGACLLGRNTAQRLLMMLGTPNGGKSTFMNILESVIGMQNVVQLRTEHLGNRFELYGFVGKTLLTGKDVPADFMLNKNAHVIKALVGHDLLSAEKKGHAEPVPLRGDFNLGITCNADLNIRLEGDLGAWRRRMMIVRYERAAPPRRIADFADQLLREEGSGILRWMVEGAIMLLDDIAETGDYRLTAPQIARVDGLLAQSDSVSHFVTQRIVADPNGELTVEELRREYVEYCETNGWVPLPAHEVSRQLPDTMLETHRTRFRHDLGINHARRGFKGVSFQQEGLPNEQH